MLRPQFSPTLPPSRRGGMPRAAERRLPRPHCPRQHNSTLMQSIQKFNGLRARPGRSVPSKQPDTGRQAVSWDEIAEKAQRLRAQNLSFKSIAAALGVEEVTLRKGLRAFGVVLPVVTRMPKPKAKQPPSRSAQASWRRTNRCGRFGVFSDGTPKSCRIHSKPAR